MASTNRPPPGSRLPIELRLLIASYVDWPTILTLRLVSRKWRDITIALLSLRSYRISSSAITYTPGTPLTIHHAEHENALTKRLKASFRNIRFDLGFPGYVPHDIHNLESSTTNIAERFYQERDKHIDWEGCEDSEDEVMGGVIPSLSRSQRYSYYSYYGQRWRRLSPIKRGVKVHILLNMMYIPEPEEGCTPILHPDCFISNTTTDEKNEEGLYGFASDPLFKPAVLGPVPVRVRYKYSYPPETYQPRIDEDDRCYPSDAGLYCRHMMDYEYCTYTFVISPSSSSSNNNILTVSDFVTQFESNMRNTFKWEEKVSVTGIKTYVNPNGWLDVTLVVEEKYTAWELEAFVPEGGERFHLHNERPMGSDHRDAFCGECDDTSEAGDSDTEVYGEDTAGSETVEENKVDRNGIRMISTIDEVDKENINSGKQKGTQHKMDIDEADNSDSEDEPIQFIEDVEEEYAVGIEERTSEPPYGHLPWFDNSPVEGRELNVGMTFSAYKDTFVEGFPAQHVLGWEAKYSS